MTAAFLEADAARKRSQQAHEESLEHFQTMQALFEDPQSFDCSPQRACEIAKAYLESRSAKAKTETEHARQQTAYKSILQDIISAFTAAAASDTESDQ